MSINFAQAQANAVRESEGSNRNEFETFVTDNILKQYAYEFKAVLEELINSRQVVASGKLADSINPEFNEDGSGFTISMLDYYDFPNEGVKGVKSGKNAQNSPYKFKNYGMNAEGRASIKEYILSGKAKVSEKRMTKVAVGLERKKINQANKKSLIDTQVDNLIYLIKRYGIKRTEYFNDAFEKVFANFSEDMAKAYGQDIAFNLRLIGKTK